MGAARPYIGQVTCQGEGALQQLFSQTLRLFVSLNNIKRPITVSQLYIKLTSRTQLSLILSTL
jgi:hypothetical protein